MNYLYKLRCKFQTFDCSENNKTIGKEQLEEYDVIDKFAYLNEGHKSLARKP